MNRLWNGEEAGAAHVRVQCGAYPDPDVLPGPNEVLIELPSSGPAIHGVGCPEKRRQMVMAVLESWDPNWLRVSTIQIDEAIYGQDLYRGQKVGWLTYVSDR